MATLDEWRAEGTRRFGADAMKWRFVCPSCGHVASAADWKAAGAPVSAVAFSCVGRWLLKSAAMGEGKRPCSYAGGGLFRLNPVIVERDGDKHNVFAFAEEGEFWFRSRVELPRLFGGGSETVECHVRAFAATLSQAKAKARYKVWREARSAGYRIGFGEVKLTLALAPTGAENWVIW